MALPSVWSYFEARFDLEPRRLERRLVCQQSFPKTKDVFGSKVFLKYSQNTTIFKIISVLNTLMCLAMTKNDSINTPIFLKL
jgi:hypothetical protein